VVHGPGIELMENLALVEVNRGCGRACRFCAVGFVYLPVRFRDPASLEGPIHDGLVREGRVGLVGSAVSDHPRLEEICGFIEEEGGRFSPSSMRVDRMTDGLAKSLGERGPRTVTIAPEAGTERMRRVVNKRWSDDEILDGIDRMAREGVPNVKLYFLVGLPTETEADVIAIAGIARRIRDLLLDRSRDRGSAGRVSRSISSFVPKPVTPFQWHPFDGIRSLDRKFRLLEGELRREPGIDLSHDSGTWAYLQSLVSRGDRRVGKFLLEVLASGGSWKKARRRTAVDTDFYVTRPRRPNELFPWEVLDAGVKRKALWLQYEKALREEPSDGTIARWDGSEQNAVSP
jgi:radical SAM superfamily enzyme YgiQ (UPF0313 family)